MKKMEIMDLSDNLEETKNNLLEFIGLEREKYLENKYDNLFDCLISNIETIFNNHGNLPTKITFKNDKYSNGTMLTVGGKRLVCECGANVFRQSDQSDKHFRCNGCVLIYEFDK